MLRNEFCRLAALVCCFCSMTSISKEQSAPVKVACIGDSITFGYGIKNRDQNSYPAQLGVLLGASYEVRNFGVSGSTLLKQGNRPYWKQQAYADALAFGPDIVLIKLGTNDSKPGNWAHRAAFTADYLELIKSFRALESGPAVWVCYPVPAFPGNGRIRDSVIKNEIVPRIGEAARQAGVPVIDLYTALSGHPDLFPDRVHPNAEGAAIIAETIAGILTQAAAH